MDSNDATDATDPTDSPINDATPTTTGSTGAPPGGRGAWVIALFALPFTAVGLAMLVLGLVPTLYDWYRIQTWQPVPAQVVSARLQTHRGSDSTTFSAVVRYRYAVGGVPYEGSRAALHAASDNFGSFQHDLIGRLQSAQRSGEPLVVWVNPSQPQESVVDRSFRPGLLAFEVAVVLAFCGAGGAMLVWCWRLYRRPGAARPVLAGRNAMSGTHVGIRADTRWELWVAWVFALAWCAIAVPAALAWLPKAWGGGNAVQAGVLLLMCAVGLGLVTWAVRATAAALRFGDVRLVLEPFPGRVGADLAGALVLARVPYGAELRFSAVLRCVYSVPGRSAAGEDEPRIREAVVWQSKVGAQVQPATVLDAAPGSTAHTPRSGVRVAFRFEVPEGLPPSGQPVGDSSHRWQVLVQSDGAALQFRQRFEVLVFASGA